jgi:hypothetical protein
MGVAESELWGEFNFRDTILEQLERYFVYLARMQKYDRGAFGLYKEIGATVLPPYCMGLPDPWLRFEDPEPKKPRPLKPLPIWFNEHRPAFGCFAYGINPKVEQEELARDFVEPKFMYFWKLRQPPPDYQPMSGGDTYKMTIWWDRPHDRKAKMKRGHPQEYGVFIGNNGSVTVLRMLDTKMVQIKRKRKLDYFSIPQRAWRLPVGPSCVEERGGAAQAQIHLANIFIDAAETFEWSNYGVVRVSVQKGDLTAVFGVNVKRTSYFFKDRDIILTDRGVKKRIFHIVRAHDRATKTGVKHIKFHFRGLREFEWAGYKVLITVPGWHHGPLFEARFGVSANYWKTQNENEGAKCTSPPTMGKIFAAGIRGDHETARKIFDQGDETAWLITMTA